MFSQNLNPTTQTPVAAFLLISCHNTAMEGDMLKMTMCDSLHNQICLLLTKGRFYVTYNIPGRELVDDFGINLLV